MTPQEEKLRHVERQVLGAAMDSRDVAAEVLEVLAVGDFHEQRHDLILAALDHQLRTNGPMEPAAIAEALKGDLSRVGGLTYLLELHNLAVAVAGDSARYYAEQVIRPAAILRAVRTKGFQLAQLGDRDVFDTGPDGALDIANAARAELDDLVESRQNRATTPEQDVYAALEELETSGAVPTPWSELTRAIGGWMPGCLYYVGGRPGVGKSVLGVDIALDMAQRNRAAHIATLEMSKAELYHRMLCNVGDVDHSDLIHRRLGPADWEKLAKAAALISPLPLSVDDSPTQRVGHIYAAARKVKRTKQLGIVVVDYLQLMSSSGRMENRQQEVSQFSRELKLMAKALDVPVVAISQLNRGPEHRANRMPGMHDLRESGSLEQDGDVVILLHRDPDTPTEGELLVAKNRHGPGEVKLTLLWEGRYSRMRDMPHTAY